MQVMLWGQEMSVEKLVAEACRDALGSATVMLVLVQQRI